MSKPGIGMYPPGAGYFIASRTILEGEVGRVGVDLHDASSVSCVPSAPPDPRSERAKYRDLLFENAMRLLVAHWSHDKHCVDSVAVNAVHDAYMDAECRAAERYPEEPEAEPDPAPSAKDNRPWRVEWDGDLMVVTDGASRVEVLGVPDGPVTRFVDLRGPFHVKKSAPAPGAGEETA